MSTFCYKNVNVGVINRWILLLFGVLMGRCITHRAWVSWMGGSIFVNTEWFITSCYKLLQKYLVLCCAGFQAPAWEAGTSHVPDLHGYTAGA